MLGCSEDITLRMAREMIGYTVDEVAEYCGISMDDMDKYERDSGEVPANVAKKLIHLYGIQIGDVYIGPECDYAKRP